MHLEKYDVDKHIRTERQNMIFSRIVYHPKISIK